MARLPVPGSDDNTWGNILNDYLGVSHNGDGTLTAGAVSTAGAEMITNKGAISGYAGLGNNSLVPTAELATGTANNTTYLRGDQTWASVVGGGSGTLSGDTDVNITSPSNNQLLTYNSGSSKWVNQVAPVISVDGFTGAVTGLLQATNNLSDLSSASSARTNLGLGTAATLASTTFLHASNNLSDLGSASSARTNLGLGNSATENVGTSAGTVMAGNQAAGGDLSGTLPNPTVAKVNGVTVNGTPSNGQVLTASNSSTASWSAPATGDAINVKDYGAKGDGSTDDSAAIIAALAVVNPIGGRIYFPAGTYLYNVGTNGVLSFGSGQGIMVFGDSPESSVIQFSGSYRAATGRVGDSPSVKLGHVGDGIRGYIMQDIGLVGASASTSAQGYANAGQDGLQTVSRCELQRVSVRHFDAGFTVNTNSGQSRWLDCIAAYNFFNFYVLYSGDDNSFIGCDFQNALFASWGTDDAQSDDWYSGTVLHTHFGFAPYGIWQSPGATGRLSTSAQWLMAKIEHVGNAAIYSAPGFASTATSGTNSTNIFDTTAPFISGMVGDLVMWGGGLGYGTIASFTSSSHITITVSGGSNPSSGQAYSVMSGTRSAASVNSGVLRDTRFQFPIYSTSGSYTIAAPYPSDYSIRLGAMSENNELWLGHLAPAPTIDIDSFAGSTRIIASAAVTVSVAGSPGTPTGMVQQFLDAGKPLANTGAASSVTWAGGTSTGPPTTGTFSSGDWIEDKSGLFWICTTGGTPGTWTLATYAVGGDHPNNKEIGFSVDPAYCRDSVTITQGVLYLMKIWTPYGGTKPINTVEVMCSNHGSVLSNCFLGVYDSSGNLLATSADQSTNWTSGTTSAPIGAALTSTATPPAAGGAAFCYLAILVGNGSTTAPKFQGTAAPAGLVNQQLIAASYRFAQNGSGLTALPGTVTLTSNTAFQPIYMGAY